MFLHHFLDIFLLLISISFFFFFFRCGMLCCYYFGRTLYVTIAEHTSCDSICMNVFVCVRTYAQKYRKWSAFHVWFMCVCDRGAMYICVCVSLSKISIAIFDKLLSRNSFKVKKTLHFINFRLNYAALSFHHHHRSHRRYRCRLP